MGQEASRNKNIVVVSAPSTPVKQRRDSSVVPMSPESANLGGFAERILERDDDEEQPIVLQRLRALPPVRSLVAASETRLSLDTTNAAPTLSLFSPRLPPDISLEYGTLSDEGLLALLNVPLAHNGLARVEIVRTQRRLGERTRRVHAAARESRTAIALRCTEVRRAMRAFNEIDRALFLSKKLTEDVRRVTESVRDLHEQLSVLADITEECTEKHANEVGSTDDNAKEGNEANAEDAKSATDEMADLLLNV